jgi:hypothetical protein
MNFDFGPIAGMSTAIFALVAIPFVLIALFFVYRIFRARGQANRAMRDWVTTQGVVLQSSVEMRRSSNSNGGTSTSYYPNVLYEYVVSGQRYQNNRIGFGMQVGLGNYNSVQRRVTENFPMGGMIQVYYDPNDPTQSVLEAKATANKYLWIIVVVIVVILACTGIFMLGGMSLVQPLIDQIMGSFTP